MTPTRRAILALGFAALMLRLLASAPAFAGPGVPVLSLGQAGVAFNWPVAAPHRVVDLFAPPTEPWLPGQRGVVLAGHNGEAILAAGAGTVSFAGKVGTMPVISIVHPAADGLASDALRTTYEPVEASVRRGELVALGQPIGHLVLAGSECAPAACLHWGLLRGSTYLNPLTLLDDGEVRLLPLAVSRFGVS